jgi:Cation transporter/ATPase, N-terminus
MNQHSLAFWSLSVAELPRALQTVKEGLTGAEATKRLALYGSNPPQASKAVGCAHTPAGSIQESAHSHSSLCNRTVIVPA